MPSGVSECSLKIQDSSCLLLNPVSLGPNLGVHHSNTENSIWETLRLSVVKCLETGVLLVSMFIHPFPKFSARFSYIERWLLLNFFCLISIK